MHLIQRGACSCVHSTVDSNNECQGTAITVARTIPSTDICRLSYTFLCSPPRLNQCLDAQSHQHDCVQGDTIVIPYNGENYYIDIQEVKPDRAVSVVETDVEVDFAPPKDYKEPDYKPAPAAVAPALPTGGSSTGAASASGSAKAAEAEPEPPRFTAFAGAQRMSASMYCCSVQWERAHPQAVL